MPIMDKKKILPFFCILNVFRKKKKFHFHEMLGILIQFGIQINNYLGFQKVRVQRNLRLIFFRSINKDNLRCTYFIYIHIYNYNLRIKKESK